MAQMVPGDQINVALRKQLLLGMFPASPTAARSHFYYLLFFRTAAEVSFQLCGNMLKAGPCKVLLGLVPGPQQPWACCLPAWCLLPSFSMTKPLMEEFRPPSPTQPGPAPSLCAFILYSVLAFLLCFPAEPKHLPV